MKAQIGHHVVSLLLSLPIMAISIYAAWDNPRLLNPFNHDMYFAGFWLLVLPALVASSGIAINSALGLRSASKHRAQPSAAVDGRASRR